MSDIILKPMDVSFLFPLKIFLINKHTINYLFIYLFIILFIVILIFLKYKRIQYYNTMCVECLHK